MKKLSALRKVRSVRQKLKCEKKQLQRCPTLAQRLLKRLGNNLDPAPVAGVRSASVMRGGLEQTLLITGQAKIVPEVLCLDSNRDQTVEFIYRIREGLDASMERVPNRDDRRVLSKRTPTQIGNYWDFST